MLRAISEIASAMIVWSVVENPMALASSRPFCRAVTMSVSRSMRTWTSPDTMTAPVGKTAHAIEAFFEVERRGHPLEVEPELHHRERDFGLDADHDGVGAAQLRRIHDCPKRPRGERVEYVEGRNVDDHASRPKAADPIRELVPKVNKILIGQRSLNRGDQDVALLEDGNGHGRQSPFAGVAARLSDWSTR